MGHSWNQTSVEPQWPSISDDLESIPHFFPVCCIQPVLAHKHPPEYIQKAEELFKN